MGTRSISPSAIAKFLLPLIGTFWVGFAAAQATTWSGFKTITTIEVVGDNGGFILTFSTPLTLSCPGSGNSAIYVYPTFNGMSADGAKAFYATAMAAFLTGKSVNVQYDSSSSNCWGRYIVIQ